MNLRVILVFLTLAIINIQADSGGSSPAGGPAGNPNAVKCDFYRGSNTLNCTKGSSSATCTTQPPVETRDDRPNGPTPRGEYLIGRRYTHKKHKIDWYKLFPKKEDSSGYYGYRDSTEKGRSTMGLHPGMTSLGCVTVKAPNYDDDDCWKQIRKVVDSGSMWYWGLWPFRFRGFLYVH